MKRPTLALVLLAQVLLGVALWWWFPGARAPSGQPAHDEEAEPAAHAPRRTIVLTAPQRSDTIAGRVHDEAQAPIPGAQVCATRVDDEAGPGRAPLCTVTAEDGTYELEPRESGWLRVAASAINYEPGHAAAPLDVGRGKPHTGIDIVLRTGGSPLSGRVVDALGGPVSGAMVRVEVATVRTLSTTTQSDENGAFKVWTRETDRLVLIASAEGYAPAIARWRAPAAGIELVLTPGGSISGRVVLRGTGEAVVGARVNAKEAQDMLGNEATSAISGSRGEFTITGAYPGRHVLSVQTDRYRNLPAAPVHVGLGQHVRDVVLEVDAAATVSGRAVLQSTDEPCQPGRFLLFSAAPSAIQMPQMMPLESAPLQPDGTFRLEGVVPGHYRALADCEKHRPLQAEPHALLVEAPGVEGLRYEFEQGQAITVMTTGPTGTPFPGAWVNVRPVPQDPNRRSAWAGITEADGTFRFGGLSPGNYKVLVGKPLGFEERDVVLSEQDTEIEVRLAAKNDGFIALQLRGAQADSDTTLQVNARRIGEDGTPSGRPFMAEPHGGGRFEIGPLEPGAYTVLLSQPQNPDRRVEGENEAGVQVGPGETVELEYELVELAGTIRGRVLDSRGAPVADTWVSPMFEGQREAPVYPVVRYIHGEKRVMTDEHGRFELSGLDPKATFTVTAERPANGARAQKKGVGVEGELILELPDPARIAGRVVDASGQPVPRFWIGAHTPSTGVSRRRPVEHPQGQFELDDVIAGEVELVVQTPTGATGRVTRAIAAGQRIDDVRIVVEPGSIAQAPGAQLGN